MHPIKARLEPFRRRVQFLDVMRILLVGGLATIGLWFFFMWLDLIVDLPAVVRWFVSRVGTALTILSFVIASGLAIGRCSYRSIAMRVDENAKTGGEILSGLELAERPTRGTQAMSHSASNSASANASPAAIVLTQGMIQIAIERAGSILSVISPPSVLSADRLRRLLWIFLLTWIGLVGLCAILPKIAWNQWQRFLHPSLDIPAYTGLVIELEPIDSQIKYGDDLMLIAKTTGSIPKADGSIERMQLVTMDQDGKEFVLPMLPKGAGQWQGMLTRITQSLKVYAKSGKHRSATGRIEVMMTPQIVATKVRITPPEYTRGAIYDGKIPPDGIVVLRGTKVEWTLTSNRPLSHGKMEWTSEKNEAKEIRFETVMEPSTESSPAADANSVQGGFEISEAGKYQIRVVDLEQNESTELLEGTIRILADKRPVVRIVEPRPLSMATPDIELPVSIMAEDDYGISSLKLFRSLNGSPFTSIDLAVDGSARQSVSLKLSLPKYGLVAGDEIQLFARTEDNDPDGAKGSESPITKIRILSVEQFQEMMLQQQGIESIEAKYRTAERHMENVSEAIRELEEAAKKSAEEPSNAEAQEKLKQKIEAAQKAAQEASEAMEKLASQPMPVDVDRELSERLKEMAKETAEAGEQLGEIAESQAGNRPLNDEESDAVEEMKKKLGRNREKLEKEGVEPLEKMQKAMPLMMDQARFVQLTEQQRDLASRLEAIRQDADPNDPAIQKRVAELEAEQDQLRQDLNQLMSDIESHVQGLPEEPEFEKLRETAREFIDALQDTEATSWMNDAQQSLLKSQFKTAANQASSAAEVMESLLAKGDAMGQEGEGACEMSFNPSKGAPQLGQSLEQLKQMMGAKSGKNKNRGQGSGQGLGMGQGQGTADRSPGPQNVGMYGSMPATDPRSQRGRGDKVSKGMATNSNGSAVTAGNAGQDGGGEGNASGQSEKHVPNQYRPRVSEYFRRLSEQMGRQE